MPTKILRDSTIVLLVRRTGPDISHVCLAMKKRGFGEGRWNGVGGKVRKDEGETIEAGAVREAEEEIGVKIDQKDLQEVAHLRFFFPHNPDWDQRVSVFIVESWEGEPTESEEMKPAWFRVADIPYESMWSADESWIPGVLGGKLFKGVFTFGEGDEVKKIKKEIVDVL